MFPRLPRSLSNSPCAPLVRQSKIQRAMPRIVLLVHMFSATGRKVERKRRTMKRMTRDSAGSDRRERHFNENDRGPEN